MTRLARWFTGLLLMASALMAEDKPDFAKSVAPIFAKYCVGCHNAEGHDGELRLDSYTWLMKGGENGPVFVAGKSGDSRMVKLISGAGKKVMPPGKRKKLDPAEIAVIRNWIDAGAPAPPDPDAVIAPIVEIPKIAPRVEPKNGIFSLAVSAKAKLIALGRYAEVELINSESLAPVRKLPGHRGNVNGVVFSSDGSKLISVSGETGVVGEVKIWKTGDGALIRSFDGHKDALYSVALSPDNKIIATGSYDQAIKLWDAATGAELRTLSGHNGAVFSLAFRPDGKILASASLDRTVKLWDVATGSRLDTLSQPLKDQFAVVFTPDGKRLAAGGADNRIRVWQISPSAADGSNSLLVSIYAHDGAILRLAFSPGGETLASTGDEGQIKLWNADKITSRLTFEPQPEIVSGLVFVDKNSVIAGRLNGTFTLYDAATGKPPKPDLTAPEPMGLQRGQRSEIKLLGKNLAAITGVKSHSAAVAAQLSARTRASGEAWVELTAKDDAPREKIEISVESAGGESNRVALFVDDLPQIPETSAEKKVTELPASFWGALREQGETDAFDFEAKAGQTIILDAAASSLGSKAAPMISVFDSSQKALSMINEAKAGAEPLIAVPIKADGRYTVRVSDGMLGGSTAHYYRISAGAFPYVTHVFPLSVKAGDQTEVSLFGHNIPAGSKVCVKPQAESEIELPVDGAKFRSRGKLKVLAGNFPEQIEQEPNDQPQQALNLPVPGSVCGRIAAAGDADIFKFSAKAGQLLIIETAAAQRGSKADTKIEVLHSDGKPAHRLNLQAMRDSYINFRPVDSATLDVRVKNYEEMELNEFLFFNGEVNRIFRMPQGPDSGFQLYAMNGARRCYFDTSGAAHANESTCYVVEPHAPGETIVPNGLPVFPLYYSNDDDGERKLGADSKLYFTAPRDGEYLVKVTDTRGSGSDAHAYRLVIREPKPDFNVIVKGDNPAVNAGSGKSFTVSAERMDGFDGEIRVEITGLPPGFSVASPLVIQAGHNDAFGTINASSDAPPPADANAAQSKVTATAMVDGKSVTKEAKNLGRIKLAEKPKAFIALEPHPPPGDTKPGEVPVVTIAPGKTVPVWLKVRRNGHEDLLTFSVENLPHGVIVDNIGLNGVLIEKGLSERQIFLTAAKWVPETERLCHSVENQAGRQTSLPVLLRVKKDSAK